MEQALLEKLKKAKKYQGAEFICFFNNGKVREDDLRSARRIKEAKDGKSFELISEVLYNATESYARNYDFDCVDMNLELGLIYKSEDVENNQIKENGEPIPGIVRIYTGSVNSYLNGEQTNERDYSQYGLGRQGFITFHQLISNIKKSGLDYIGPKSFEEFKKKTQRGEPIDIKISANLNEKEKINAICVTKTR